MNNLCGGYMKHFGGILRLLIGFIFTGLLSFSLCAMQKGAQKSVPSTGASNLIILVDWNNESVGKNLSKASVNEVEDKGVGAITTGLMAALDQKAAPVLVSVDVWKNFIERRQIFRDLINTKIDTPTLVNKYGHYARFGTTKGAQKMRNDAIAYAAGGNVQPAESREMLGFFLPAQVAFDQTQWDIYYVGAYYYLCVPKTYKNGQGRDVGAFSAREVACGLKLSSNNLFRGDVLDVALHAGSYGKSRSGSSTSKQKDSDKSDFSHAIIDALSSIIITQEEFTKARSEKDQDISLPSWIVYLTGHGSPAAQGPNVIDYIAGLESGDFRKLLQFFDRSVSTSFLFYDTCYAGGLHLVAPYQTQGKVDVYSYVIASATISHVMTLSSAGFKRQGNQVTLTFDQNFGEFFSEACTYFFTCPSASTVSQKAPASKKDTSAVTLQNCINKVHKMREGSQTEIPAVRFPYTEWFLAQNVDQSVMRVTQVIAHARAAEDRPIVVKDKKVVILENIWSEAPGAHVASLESKKKDQLKREYQALDREVEKLENDLRAFSSKTHVVRNAKERDKLQAQFDALVNLYQKKFAQREELEYSRFNLKQNAQEAFAGERTLSVPAVMNIEGTMPLFMTMMPGNAFVHIKGIQAPNLGLTEFVKGLIEFSDHYYGKAYLIDSVSVMNDLVKEQSGIIGAAPKKEIVLKDVVVLNNARNPYEVGSRSSSTGIIFRFNDKGYSALLGSNNAAYILQELNKKQLPPIVSGRVTEEQEKQLKTLQKKVPQKFFLKEVAEVAGAHKEAAQEGEKAEALAAFTPEGDRSILKEWQPGRLKQRAQELGLSWDESGRGKEIVAPQGQSGPNRPTQPIRPARSAVPAGKPTFSSSPLKPQKDTQNVPYQKEPVSQVRPRQSGAIAGVTAQEVPAVPTLSAGGEEKLEGALRVLAAKFNELSSALLSKGVAGGRK